MNTAPACMSSSQQCEQMGGLSPDELYDKGLISKSEAVRANTLATTQRQLSNSSNYSGTKSIPFLSVVVMVET